MKAIDLNFLGSYRPAFFLIFLNTNADILKQECFTENLLATLCHEYVHFIQDITTTYSLMNICHIVDLQKTLNRKILANNEKVFNVPILLKNSDPASINLDLISLYYCSEALKCETYEEILEINLVENSLIQDYEQLQTVDVTVKSKGEMHTFSFGAFCILESMAHLIEKHLFSRDSAPQFPYKTVEEVTKFLYPELAENIKTLVYLCDISLNSFHPGKFFYNAVIDMKREGILPTSQGEIIDFCLRYRFVSEANEEPINLLDLFETISSMACTALPSYFTNDIFAPIRTWLITILSRAKITRQKEPLFWATILEKEPLIQKQNALLELMTKIGLPIITNSNYQAVFSTEFYECNELITAFQAVNEIHDILTNCKKECGLIGFCKTSPKMDFVTAECKSAPWSRANEANLCPFGQIWRMWGFAEKQPLFNK